MRTLILLLSLLFQFSASAAYSGYIPNWLNSGSTNADLAGNGTANALTITNTLAVGGATTVSSIVATNGATLTGVATASLPANGAGKIIYCTDCLTPQGTGSLVFNDGTTWRLPSGITATITPETYLISLLKGGRVQGDGQYDAGWIDRYVGPGGSASVGSIARVITITGTGAAIATAGVNVTGAGGALTLTSGTTATGVAGWRSTDFDLLNQGYDFVSEIVFNLSALSTVADEYWILFGLTSMATIGSTADANNICLLYDRLNTWATTGGTATNWKIFTRKSGVGNTITETSVPVATGLHSFRVCHTAAGTTSHFYIDGVQVGGDVTSNLPASLTSLRLGFDEQNTAHAGAAISANHIAVGYALRRTTALYQ